MGDFYSVSDSLERDKRKAQRIASFRKLVPNCTEVRCGVFQSADDTSVLFTANGKWKVDGVWGNGKANLKNALRKRRGGHNLKELLRKEAATIASLPLTEWERKFSESIRKFVKRGRLTEKQVNCANGILDKVGEEHCEILFGIKQLGIGVVRPPKNKAQIAPVADRESPRDEPDDSKMTKEYLHLMRQILD